MIKPSVSSGARAHEFSCSELIYDQRGEPVCLHNLDAPGCCWPYCCPYGGPFKKGCREKVMSRQNFCGYHENDGIKHE